MCRTSPNAQSIACVLPLQKMIIGTISKSLKREGWGGLPKIECRIIQR
jgi:hypothetical protein